MKSTLVNLNKLSWILFIITDKVTLTVIAKTNKCGGYPLN